MSQIIDKIDLRNLAGKYVELSGGVEMAGPCPKCGGTDRFHVTADSWFCRECKPIAPGRGWWDAIDFVQFVQGCSYADAVTQLGGALDTPAHRAAPTVKTFEHQPVTEEWRRKAEEIVRAAHDTLMIDGDGAEYLEGRGIQPATWRKFKLGFKADVALPGTWDKEKKTYSSPPQPAIVIPWYRGGRLTAVRYRFLKTHTYTAGKKSRTVKQSAQWESDFAGALYGGQALVNVANELRTLVLCEGEINAISIWQVTNAWQWDVLSLGSESQKLTAAALEFARQFERVLVWMDKREVALEIMDDLPGSYGIRSTYFGDIKRDANEMLKSGSLGAFLATARYNACTTQTERLRFMYNLQDANLTDDKVISVYTTIKGKELGK